MTTTMTLGQNLSTVTLYERLGGASGIRALVDGIVGAHLKNPVIEARFRPNQDRPERVSEIKRHTCAFLSEGSCGPDTYRGRSMAEAHRGMDISDTEYAAAAEDILATLARHGHGAETQAEVREIIGGLRDEIKAIDDRRAADQIDGGRIGAGCIGLAPEHGDRGLGAVGRIRIVRGEFARGGDLVQHGAGGERAGRDGDRLAGVVAMGFPDEEAAGMRAFDERGHDGLSFQLEPILFIEIGEMAGVPAKAL